jgi:hypothetical protein
MDYYLLGKLPVIELPEPETVKPGEVDGAGSVNINAPETEHYD